MDQKSRYPEIKNMYSELVTISLQAGEAKKPSPAVDSDRVKGYHTVVAGSPSQKLDSSNAACVLSNKSRRVLNTWKEHEASKVNLLDLNIFQKIFLVLWILKLFCPRILKPKSNSFVRSKIKCFMQHSLT